MASKSVLGALVQVATLQVTQSAADAFVSGQLSTGISTASRYGWLLDRVVLDISTNAVAAPQTSDVDITMQLYQGPAVTSVLAFDIDDLVCMYRVVVPGIAAAVNAYTLPVQSTWDAPENFVLVDPLLNLLIDSTSTGVSLVGTARVFYYPVELSEMDILRLIAQR